MMQTRQEIKSEKSQSIQIMNTSTALHICLVLHLSGLVLMAGMSIADFIAYRSFWKQYAINKQEGLTMLNAASAYQRVMAIGAILLLITGVGMMALTHGVFGEQLWMRIKIGIVVLILINGPVIGRMQGTKLKKLIEKSILHDTPDLRISVLRSRVNLISVANFIFLISIVVLSIFKFN
ncbi:MAG: hypothetical protein JWO03_3697 [Bacteroidetes bacterium]|nr:hypothetical protein [Bacteroidota bacterium]